MKGGVPMNWYKVVGVMDDGASIYGEEVIVAASFMQQLRRNFPYGSCF